MVGKTVILIHETKLVIKNGKQDKGGKAAKEYYVRDINGTCYNIFEKRMKKNDLYNR